MTGDQRFVVSVRIIGTVRRDAPKLKMFMMSVLWSDGSEVIVYRSLQDFKNFHSGLKKRFPHGSTFPKKDRMIPKFNGKAVKSSLQQKGSKRSVRRMKFLDIYCDELLKCDQTVTQSSQVTQFFTPKDHDVQTDYTKNSIMILLSDDLPDESGGGRGSGGNHRSTGSVTQPFMTQTYRCVAAHETKDTKNRPFKVAMDEKVDVLIKDPAGWWLVENEEKRLAWFPAPFLELWGGEEDEDDGPPPGGALYCAVRSYSTKKSDEVSVPIGSVVEVLRKSDNGWWLIRFNGKAGYIPSMYLQLYNNPHMGLHSLRKLSSSNVDLNPAAGRESQASYPASVIRDGGSHRSSEDSAGCSRDSGVPGSLQKARSLDVLSDALSQTERYATSEAFTHGISSQSSSSSFSSDSESSSQLGPRYDQTSASDSERSSPDLSFSDSFSEISESSKGSESAPVAPKVPPRPRTEEILTRCTTMTRKAALATKSRLQMQPESVHSRQ